MAPGIDDPFLDDNEPSAAQEGVDVPGSRSAFTDFINFGVYNGNFRIGPPQSLSNLDVAASTSGSNFVPGWRWVLESGDLTAKSVGETFWAPGGSNLVISGSSGTGYIEQILDIGGSSARDTGGFIRVNARCNATPTGTQPLLEVRSQYLTSAGATSGSERTSSVTITESLLEIQSFDGGSEVDPPARNARYLRLRIAVTLYNSSAGVCILDVRRDRAPSNIRLPDRSSPTTYVRSGLGLYDVYQSGSNLLWQPSSTTAGTTTTKRVLNYQLVPITWSESNVAAGATTTMRLPTTVNGALTLPWEADIVGVSARRGGTQTAGTWTLQIVVNGSNVWSPFGAEGAAGPYFNATSQEIGTDTVSIGDNVNPQIVTSAAYAPTTLDFDVVVWFAVKYDGN